MPKRGRRLGEACELSECPMCSSTTSGKKSKPDNTGLPDLLYVKVEEGEDGLPYFTADEEVANLVAMSETVALGVYRRVNVVEVRGVVVDSQNRPLHSPR